MKKPKHIIGKSTEELILEVRTLRLACGLLLMVMTTGLLTMNMTRPEKILIVLLAGLTIVDIVLRWYKHIVTPPPTHKRKKVLLQNNG